MTTINTLRDAQQRFDKLLSGSTMAQTLEILKAHIRMMDIPWSAYPSFLHALCDRFED